MSLLQQFQCRHHKYCDRFILPSFSDALFNKQINEYCTAVIIVVVIYYKEANTRTLKLLPLCADYWFLCAVLICFFFARGRM